MTLRSIIKVAQKKAVDNSPAILTAIGVTGTLTVAYLTGRASLSAGYMLAQADQDMLENNYDVPLLTNREKFDMVWKLYIPPAGACVLTISAIICANRVGTRRTAAMAAVYTLSEKAYSEYREKVVETIGKNQEQKIRDSVAQDRIDRNPPSREVIIAGNGEVLCHDAFSSRYFMSSMERLKKAQNDINYQILSDDYATVTNFYTNIGLEPTSISDEMGWNTDKRLELLFSTTMSPDNQPCISFDFASVPIHDPWRFC